METNPKPLLENLEFTYNHIVTTHHRKSKNKWINLYPSSEADPAFHLAAFDFLLDSIQKGVAPQDVSCVLTLLQKCLKALQGNTQANWDKALDTLGIFVRRQGLSTFLYEEKSEEDRLLFEVLKHFPKESLVKAIRNCKDHATFHTVCKFLAQTDELKAHRDVVVIRLKEEFLVDKSRLLVKMTPYIAKSILDEAVFEDLLSSAIKLIKRSESNLETLIVFLENISFDLSKRAFSLIFDDLKDLLVAKEKEKVEKFHRGFKAIVRLVQDPAVLDKIFGELIKAVHNNNQEQVKVSVLQLMVYMVKLDKEQSKAWCKALFGTIASSANFLTGDETAVAVLSELKSLREHLRKKENPPALGLEEKEYANLRKQVANVNINKNTLSILCAIFVLLLDFEREDGNLIKELGTLIETAYANNVTANVKAILKLVTTYTGFISTLLSASVYLKGTENAKLDKAIKGDIVAILDENSFLNMQKFFNKVNYDELSCWLRTLGLNAERLSSALSFSDTKFNILSSTLTETLTHPLMNNRDIGDFFKDVQEKDFMYYAILNGFFNKLYISTEAELERVRYDKMWLTLHHIVKDLESVTPTEEFTLKLFWLINCERLNPNLKLRSTLDKRMHKNEELKEKMNNAVQEMYDNLKGFLLSKDGLFAHGRTKSETAVNMSCMLIKWGNYELLSEFKLFIKLDNYSDAAEIEKFEEDMKRDDFESEVSDYLGVIHKLGITEAKPQEETKTNDKAQANKGGKAGKGAPAKGPAGAAANKKGGKDTKDAQKPKQQYMDQEEILKMKQEELRKKMAGYLEIVGRVLKKILKMRDPEITKEYFSRCHEELKELAQEEAARGTVEGIIYVLLTFSPYKPIVRSTDQIVRAYFCKLSGIEMDYDEITENFVNGIKNLKDLDVSTTDPNYANIVYDACQYILVSENLDNKLKSNALAVIIKIGTTGDSNELGSEILQMMVDYLDNICNYPETQNLFAFLMEKFVENVVDSLFSYLLDYKDEAKILCLKTLAAMDKPEVFKEFERYLKIMILSLDENETIVNLSKQLLAKYKLTIKHEHIEGFNVKDFVNTESNDSVEKFCKCTPEIIKEAPTAANILIQKSIEAAEHLANNKEIQKMEDALFFLPFLAQNNLPYLKDFLPKIFEIFVEQYCVETYPTLTEKTLEVGADIVKQHGNEKGDFILQILEKYLDKKYSAQINVTAIILMGACAAYLKDKSKVKSICDKIIITANSPSDHVKKNIAKCLPQLIGFFENPHKIAQDLLDSLLTEKDLNKAKGAAYILSGFVKGLGVQFMEEMKVIQILEQNSEGKKVSPNTKLAIVALIQAFTENLGKTFEPYFLKLLQILMNFYGEQQEEIRLASLRCTKAMMSYLSAYGVRQVLPQLLKGIEEKTWRAKVASISVLGNMAFCAPKQLSSCLPQIVPKLAQALSDPHPIVQEKGNLALKEIGSTIKNPEISDIAEILIKALSNPYEENKKGLEVLLQTQFVHYIDTASLSLIIPIIEYGLRNRDSTLRMNASQLIGSISNLIKNPTDLDPYLTMLINALKMAICDTLSEVRAIAAKACGSLCEKLGLENSAKLILSIQEILENGDSTSIDRAGAAQAMSEITYALGKSYIDKVLPVYLANTSSTQIHIRESYIGIFAFLPAIMEDEFEPYISDVIDNIIDVISDENETTRNLAIRVCKILIQRFGLKKASILMDPAEAGLFSSNWRRRNSSVILVGEMLEILQRCERKGLTKDVETDYNEKYNRIVTSLHILKFDNSENVKHMANQIWKTFVDNTPKTLKSILPMLIDKLIHIIAEVEENAEMAATCIHEFGAKYAESMFRDIFGHLEAKKTQHMGNSQYVKALCILLDTLINSMSDDFVEGKKDSILSLILDLLITSDDYVRASACKVLQTLLRKCKHSNLIEEIIPNSFKELEKLDESDPKYDEYLKFFDEIIQFEIDTHLEYLGECLFNPPLTQYKLDIITNNAEAFGPELYEDNFFFNVIDSLFTELLKSSYSEPLKQSILYCINQLSVHLDESKLSSFFHTCFQLIESRNLKDNKNKVYYGLDVLHFYFQNTSHDFFQYVGQILTNVTIYFTSPDNKILGLVNEILNSILNSLEQEQCFEIIKTFNQCIESAVQLGTKAQVSTIRAFSVEDGLDPYINMVVKSLVYGPINIVDQTLTTYEYIIEYTEKAVLENYVLKLVGPLIRVAFYKYENEVKGRIVSTILKFEEKGLSLLIFLPQLHTTFVRMISDYNGEKNYLRVICDGLKYVSENSKKRDFLLNDLLNKYLTADTSIRKFAYVFCIYRIIKKNQKAFSKAMLDKVSEKLQDLKDLSIGSDQNKYIGRIYGFLVCTEVVNKQKDIITAYLDKLDAVNDKEYLIYERLLSTMIFCDPKVLEQFDAGMLEKKISGALKVIKAKNNVLYALQDVKKLKDSTDKVKAQLGQAVIDNNNFREMYSNLTREEEIEEILRIL